MFADHVTASSSSSKALSSSTTLFRVRRKRTADPHGALVISLKRPKQMSTTVETVNEPIICLRATATDFRFGLRNPSQSQQINVIDVDPNVEKMSTVEVQPVNVGSAAVEDGKIKNVNSNDDILELFQDAPEEASAGSMIVGEVTISPSQITLNDVTMAVLTGQDDEEFIFDYYWSSKADGCTVHQIRDVRLANADDLLLYDGEDTESSVEDDDEDSNDENNWRNDYPDESEHTSGCGSDENTTSDGCDDYDHLEKYLGELDFYEEEDNEGDVYERGVPQVAACRLTRWAIALMNYQFTIKYKNTKEFGQADGLSRLPRSSSELFEMQFDKDEAADELWVKQLIEDGQEKLPITANEIAEVTDADTTLSKVKKFVVSGWPEKCRNKDMQAYFMKRAVLSVCYGFLMWGIRTVIPKFLHSKMLDELHCTLPGRNRMTAIARQHCWWPAIDGSIEGKVKLLA